MRNMLNVRVSIKTFGTSKDEYGQPIQILSDEVTRWAEVRKASGNMYNNGATEWIYDIEVKMWYFESDPTLESNIVNYKNKDYKILNVSYDDQGYRMFEVLKCKAVSSGETVPVGNIIQIGFSELDTTGEVNSESDYLSSINSQLPAPTQKTITGNVIATPGEFGNTSDKVLFIVADKDLIFTKWSILNDPFQQDQPIDQIFDINSGNVIFKIIDGTNAIYATYLQTTFANNLILS